MSLDKLIAAATDFFSTGAEVHRRALAGGGGKITDLSEKPATKTVATKAKDTPAPVEKPTIDAVATAEAKAATAENKALLAAVQVPVPDAAAPYADAPRVVTDVVAKLGDPAVGEDDLDGGAPVLDYEADIRPVLRAKTLTNREGLIALLGTFGVKSGAELTAAQYAAFFAGLKAL